METASSFTIPIYIRQLKNLSAILVKVRVSARQTPYVSTAHLHQAEEWCTKNDKPHSEIIEAKLYQTMPALPYQVLVCTSMARNSLLGPDWKYITSNAKLDEDFASMQERIKSTIEALQSCDEKVLEEYLDKPLSVLPSGQTILCKLLPL